MTGPDDYTNTRPISVAELLAKNGTIGAPPVGGRRRRRRGNADAVTVAELTGEIPIVRPDEPAAAPEPEPEPEPEPVAETVEDDPDVDEADDIDDVPDVDEADDDADDADDVADAAEVTEADDELVEVEDSDPDSADEVEVDEAEADDDAVVEDTPDEPQVAPARRSPFGRFGRKSAPAVDAELMSPDPVDADAPADVDEAVSEQPEAETATDTETDDTADDPEHTDDAAEDDTAEDDAAEDDAADDELPSYLRSTQDPLFGGETVADDVARRGGQRASLDLDEDDEDEDEDEPRQMSPVVHGLWVVGQSVVAVAFGAGLFVAFDQLWKWNNIVALVLSVLVILGLVVGVRVVRKTEDIGSTLIAVAVGALVTLGPLALLQSG
ncbi:MAG: hypothetical protein PGN37_02235 [Mycobacterium kyogaense]|uniref:hypothetical protein n=1 Tax=Mycobacterium kyogaense TaxID=2212479 RepID=UPI002FF4A0C6